MLPAAVTSPRGQLCDVTLIIYRIVLTGISDHCPGKITIFNFNQSRGPRPPRNV